MIDYTNYFFVMGTIVRQDRYFWIFLLAGIFLGACFPFLFKGYDFLVLYIIMAIMCILFLKVDIIDVVTHVKRPILLIYISTLKLIILPFIIYFCFRSFDTNTLMAFVLFAALPAGVSSAAFTDIMKGRTSLSLTTIICTNLICIFTIPLVFFILFNQQMDMDYMGLFLNLSQLIVIPFIIAKFLKHFVLRNLNQKLQKHYNLMIIGLLTFMIMISISFQIEYILQTWHVHIKILGFLFLEFILFQLIGYFSVFWQSKGEKIAASNSFMIMNNILGIVLALAFFNVEVLSIVILSLIPWNVMIIGKHWYKRYLP